MKSFQFMLSFFPYLSVIGDQKFIHRHYHHRHYDIHLYNTTRPLTVVICFIVSSFHASLFACSRSAMALNETRTMVPHLPKIRLSKLCNPFAHYRDIAKSARNEASFLLLQCSSRLPICCS